MNNIELFDALSALAKEKEIEPDVLIEKIQTAIVIAVKKDYPRSENIEFNIDIEKGKFEVCINKEIVATPEEVEDDANQIDLESALKISKRAKVGGVSTTKLNTRHFGRIAAQTAKQVIKQGIKEVEREMLIEQWGDLHNACVATKVMKVEPGTGNVIVEVEGAEVVLFANEQIPGETIKTGDTIKVFISGVSANDRRPTLKLSRTHNNFIRRLLENEVPEIQDGIVEIYSVTREPGKRAKVAVFSNDENVDPIGSCIGPNRSRIMSVCDELNGEKIDVIMYNEDPGKFITQALRPAEVLSVEIPDEEQRFCVATVPDSQLSLAIGHAGQNAKLAARLTGYNIDIRPLSGFYEGSTEKDVDTDNIDTETDNLTDEVNEYQSEVEE